MALAPTPTGFVSTPCRNSLVGWALMSLAWARTAPWTRRRGSSSSDVDGALHHRSRSGESAFAYLGNPASARAEAEFVQDVLHVRVHPPTLGIQGLVETARFELATPCLQSRCSPTELRPHAGSILACAESRLRPGVPSARLHRTKRMPVLRLS